MKPLLSGLLSLALVLPACSSADDAGGKPSGLLGDTSSATPFPSPSAVGAGPGVREQQQAPTPTTAPTQAPPATATTAPQPSPTNAPAPAATTAPQPTATPAPPTAAPTPTANPRSGCSPAYPSVCIPPPPPDLDCKDVQFKRFTVLAPDPHRFDSDNDGIGCES